MTNIPTQLEQAIIDYYLLPHSERDTVCYFNLSGRYQLNKLLLKYNITKHSKETIKQLNKNNTERGCLLKYGVKNAMQVKEIADKTRQSLLARTDEEIKAATMKASMTKQNLYGDANYNNRKKAAETCAKVYSGTSPMNSDEIKMKVAQTNLTKYGVKNVFQAETVKQKIAKTCKERYGDASYTKTADYKAKTTATCQTKYGTNYYCQSQEYAKIAHKKYNYDNTTFDSSWELALWIYAKDHNEQIERCPVKLNYLYNNTVYYCIPDFNYLGDIIEIKGSQFIKDNKFICPYDQTLNDLFEAKQKCLITNNVKIWTKKDIKFALDYIDNKYGKKYLKKFRYNKEEKTEEGEK